ncbi:hypothetical protein CJF32_00007408 [Rutstroemia sp. NJR-2017a WRK4]|nr:hypothetical protein CJF32_00007408 [Rutstroemia sp. NJR-2017a WRK4]
MNLRCFYFRSKYILSSIRTNSIDQLYFFEEFKIEICQIFGITNKRRREEVVISYYRRGFKPNIKLELKRSVKYNNLNFLIEESIRISNLSSSRETKDIINQINLRNNKKEKNYKYEKKFCFEYRFPEYQTKNYCKRF